MMLRVQSGFNQSSTVTVLIRPLLPTSHYLEQLKSIESHCPRFAVGSLEVLVVPPNDRKQSERVIEKQTSALQNSITHWIRLESASPVDPAIEEARDSEYPNTT
jgi:hypothetical protein